MWERPQKKTIYIKNKILQVYKLEYVSMKNS